VHAVAEVHETLSSSPPPRGSGVLSIAHLEPFQRSARVIQTRVTLSYAPTAVHAVADVHDTPLSCEVAGVRAADAVFWIVSREPFQRSTKVRWGKLDSLFWDVPTAKQSLDAGQEMLFSPANVWPAGV
jgi:hypothetical protein